MSLGRAIVQIVRRKVNEMLADLHTSMPAQVEAYDAATNTVTIQPCIMRLRPSDPEQDTIQLPLIKDVPVVQHGNGKLWLTAAPQVGSYGVYHVAERAIEQWLNDGGIVEPGSWRKFDLSDGFFVPGLVPLKADGDNGKFAEAIKTDRVELRTRTGTTSVSVLDDESILIQTENTVISIAVDESVSITTDGQAISCTDGTGTLSLDGSGVFLYDNGSGTFELKANGQFDVNGNFTVDP